MRAAGRDNVCACVDHRVREGDKELRRVVPLGAAFVRVRVDDRVVRDLARVPHDRCHGVDIFLERLGVRSRLVADDEASAEYGHLVGILARGRLSAFAAAASAGRHASRGQRALHRVELLARDHLRRREPQRVQAGTRPGIAP